MTRKDVLSLVALVFLALSWASRLGMFGDSSTCWYLMGTAGAFSILATAWK